MYILKGDPKGHSQNVGVDRQGHFKGERADFAKSLKKRSKELLLHCLLSKINVTKYKERNDYYVPGIYKFVTTSTVTIL